MEKNSNIIELRNIKKVFDDTAAVEDFNLTVRRGEFVTFLGPSGCGKTTTLRMIAGFEFPTEGEILLNGGRHQPSAAQSAADQYGVPALRPVPAPECI